MPAYRWDAATDAYVNCRTGDRVERFIMDETMPTWDNTGPQIPLTTTYTGTMNISAPTTLRGMDITGRVVVQNAATGLVRLEHCRIDASSLAPSTSSVVSVQVNTGATVEIVNCEIIGQAGMIGVGVRRFKAIRNRIHHVEDGFRCNNFSGTGQDAATEIAGNYIGPLITLVPDPNQVRTDNRTHSDGIQVEGGANINIHGNTIHAMNTTDGTSNIENFSASEGKAVASGTAGSSPHPQALSGVLLNPGVSAITDIKIEKNWFVGGAVALNAGATTSGTTGSIAGNRFDRGSWYATPQIGIDATSTSLTTADNTFVDDGAAVTVARNW